MIDSGTDANGCAHGSDILEPVVFGPDWSATHPLHDGTVATIRLVRPEDKPLFQRAAGEFSTDTMVRRFFAPKPRFSDSELAYLTEVDAVNHLAIVALRPDPKSPGQCQGLGAARFIRDVARPWAAEFAIVVHDDFHGSGLGSALLRHLVAAAQERGVTRFTGDILATNTAAFRLIDRLAPDAEWLTNGIVALVEFDISGM